MGVGPCYSRIPCHCVQLIGVDVVLGPSGLIGDPMGQQCWPNGMIPWWKR